MSSHGPEFEAFWKVYPHPKSPRSRGSKPKCRLYWHGKKATEGELLITTDILPLIMEGAAAHRENVQSIDPEYWPMCQTWLHQERWETALEIKAEREAERVEAEREEAERKARAADREAWREEAERVRQEERLQRFQDRFGPLKVVGEN